MILSIIIVYFTSSSYFRSSNDSSTWPPKASPPAGDELEVSSVCLLEQLNLATIVEVCWINGQRSSEVLYRPLSSLQQYCLVG